MLKYKKFILLLLIVGCSTESPQNNFESLLDSEWSKLVSDNPVYASSMGVVKKSKLLAAWKT